MAIRQLVRSGSSRGVAISVVAALAVLITWTVGFLPVSATQNPPPQTYTVTVNRSGGGDCTQLYLDSPSPATSPTSESFQRTFTAGTWVDVAIDIDCPCGYRLKHWLIDGEVKHGSGPHQIEGFTLAQNTTATAVFEPRTGTLVVYVDDPTPNSLLPHLHDPLSGNTGHAFWELTGNCVPSALACGLGTWGFYPPGELREDDDHDFTDQRSYVISQDQLISALYLTCFFIDSPPAYNMVTYNCTDALIDVAGASGVTLSAYGSCEHFVGNCPGVLGETLNL